MHYAIGRDEVITPAFELLKGAERGSVLKGIYHTEPQSLSCELPGEPGALPLELGRDLALHPGLGVLVQLLPRSAGPVEKTFAVWALFQMYAHRERGKCNQLCAWEGT